MRQSCLRTIFVSVLFLTTVLGCLSVEAVRVNALQAQEVTVYITNTGKKYHRSSCRFLKKSKIAISLSDAKAKGYTACKVYKPPS